MRIITFVSRVYFLMSTETVPTVLSCLRPHSAVLGVAARDTVSFFFSFFMWSSTEKPSTACRDATSIPPYVVLSPLDRRVGVTDGVNNFVLFDSPD